MFDLAGIDVAEIPAALEDQTDYEHRWLHDPKTGQVAFWASDTGIDGENPAENFAADHPDPDHPCYRHS